jgi:hypothetical protein
VMETLTKMPSSDAKASFAGVTRTSAEPRAAVTAFEKTKIIVNAKRNGMLFLNTLKLSSRKI